MIRAALRLASGEFFAVCSRRRRFEPLRNGAEITSWIKPEHAAECHESRSHAEHGNEALRGRAALGLGNQEAILDSFLKVEPARCNQIAEGDRNVLVEPTGTPGHEGSAMFRSVLLRRTDEFNRGYRQAMPLGVILRAGRSEPL